MRHSRYSIHNPLNAPKCQCEHSGHDGGCTFTRQRERKTPYGTYKVCVSCYEREHMVLTLSQDAAPLPDGFIGF